MSTDIPGMRPNEPLRPQQFEDLPAIEQAVDAQLTLLVEQYNLSPHLAAAYSSQSHPLYMYGAGSEGLVHRLAAAKQVTLEGMTDIYDRTYGVQFVDPQLRDQTRSIRQRVLSTKHNASDFMDRVMDQPSGRQWVEHTVASRDIGLDHSEVAHVIANTNALHYFFETPPRSDPVVVGSPAYAPFLEAAFGRQEVDPSLKESDLVRQLREQGLIDLSKEYLDARVTSFSAAVQIEASAIFLADLWTLNSLGGKYRRDALVLANKYKESLLADDYAGSVTMTSDLAAMCRRLAHSSTDPRVSRFIDAIGRRSRHISSDLSLWLEGFAPVYEHLGYELHPLLQSLREEQAPPAQPKPVQLPDAVPVEILPDEIQVREIEYHMEVLRQRAALFSQTWRMNARERRDLGLTAMQRELVNGFRDYAGVQVLSAMDKELAKEFVDILAHLRGLAADSPSPKVARERLAEAVDEQRAILDDIELVRMVAQDADIQIAAPYVAPVEGIAEAMRADWRQFTQLILKTWPYYEGAAVVRQLEGLLFTKPQAAEALPETQRVVAAQESIARQLDRIILPPEATRHDLERELRRIGAQTTSTSSVDWQRLQSLIKIREEFDGTLFRSKESLGGGAPYFVVAFTFGSDTFAVAETPRSERATYVVCERLAAGTWLEVLELRIREAKSVGAHQVIHSQGSGAAHIDRIYTKILELQGA